MNFCPCCKDTLLYHISHNRVYWFCPSCWQEMPVCAQADTHSLTKQISAKISQINQKIGKSSLNNRKIPVSSS